MHLIKHPSLIKGNKMVIVSIAEWISNIFILGVAALMWAISFFLFGIMFSLLYKWIKSFLNTNNEVIE